jgi:microcystin-dependent protein
MINMNIRAIISLLLLTMLGTGLTAQNRGFGFQAYAIDSAGFPMAGTSISARFTIYDINTPSVNYQEEQTFTTDANGVFRATVGGGTTFANLSFSTRVFWLKAEVRKTSDAAYSIISDAPLSIVPYARSAENGSPLGSVAQFAGSTLPNGWMLCDGSQLSRTTYADLFAAIGTRFGTGDGSTTFNLPDLRGKIPVGYNSAETSFNTLGKTGGAKTQTLTVANLPSHSHSGSSFSTTSAGSHTHTYVDEYTPGNSLSSTVGTLTAAGFPTTTSSGSTNSDGSHPHSISGNTASTGSDSPFNIMMPYVTVNFIIRVY